MQNIWLYFFYFVDIFLNSLHLIIELPNEYRLNSKLKINIRFIVSGYNVLQIGYIICNSAWNIDFCNSYSKNFIYVFNVRMLKYYLFYAL